MPKRLVPGAVEGLRLRITRESKMNPNEPQYDKTNKMICTPSEDSDQHEHPSSLISVFAVRPLGS